MSREEFEKLDEIKNKLTQYEHLFKFSSNQYICEDSYIENYLNGAWYAWQEQQNKIDEAIKHLDSVEGLVWYEEVKELLK